MVRMMLNHLLAVFELWRSQYQNRWTKIVELLKHLSAPNLGWLPDFIPVLEPVYVKSTPQFLQKNKFWLLWLLAIFLLGPTASLAQAAQTEPPPGVTLRVVGPASVNVGDAFEIQVVADVSPPGMFGYQFWLTWNNDLVMPVEAAPRLSPDFPLVAQSQITPGQIQLTASRQGEMEDLAGSFTLLTWTFRANAAIQADTALFDLIQATFGQKNGLAIPIAGLTHLSLVIVEPVTAQGTLAGVISAQGRGPGNQAGYIVTIKELGLTTTTLANGDFTVSDVPFGLYTLTVTYPGYLSLTCPNLTHQNQLTTLAGATLRAGDFNSDGQINIADSTSLGLALGPTPPGAATDINGDNQTNVLDLILMATNFGQTEAQSLWVCQ
jgi:hypothetical protein